MKHPRSRQSQRIHPLAYLALVVYICIFFVSAWFSSYQNKVALQIRQEFKQRKNQLLDEINKLEMQEAELTSIERIHEIAQELHMVLPSEPAHTLQSD
jgi:cell division protein FtsL